MTRINPSYVAALFLAMIGFSSSLHAQDILNTTGQTVRSYNYVEGFYLLNVEDDLPDNAEVNLPALFRLSVDLIDRVSLNGKYINQSYEIDFGPQGTLEADVLLYELGLRYRGELAKMQNTDWIAGLGYGIIDIDINDGTTRVTGTTNIYTFYLGGRRTISDRIEFELGLIHERNKDGDITSTEGEAALVYRLADRLDVALGAVGLSGPNSYGIGVRYTWD